MKITFKKYLQKTCDINYNHFLAALAFVFLSFSVCLCAYTRAHVQATDQDTVQMLNALTVRGAFML